MSRPDPLPSDWLLNSRYGGDKVLSTRAKRRIFTLRYEKSALTVTTSTGTKIAIEPADFQSDWTRLSADPNVAVSKLSQSGSYVQAIYDDLHAPVGDGESKRVYSVYVIELDEGVWADADMQARNPNPDLSKPCVYVGYTSEPVWTRFQKHLTGKRFSRRVRRFGLRPLPELYGAVNPLPDKAAALEAEAALTNALRASGFRVWEGELGDLHLDKS